MIDLQVIPALREDDCDQLDIGSVREFPRFGYSMKEVRRAGVRAFFVGLPNSGSGSG
jgi:hypothetical protein